MLGWTQKDAVDVLGLARQSITDVAEKNANAGFRHPTPILQRQKIHR